MPPPRGFDYLFLLLPPLPQKRFLKNAGLPVTWENPLEILTGNAFTYVPRQKVIFIGIAFTYVPKPIVIFTGSAFTYVP